MARSAERRSVRRMISSSCSQLSPTKEWSSSKRKSPSDLSSSSACSAPSRYSPYVVLGKVASLEEPPCPTARSTRTGARATAAKRMGEQRLLGTVYLRLCALIPNIGGLMYN
jgi:hypothetical protein